MWDRSSAAHAAAGCTVGGNWGSAEKHSKNCPDRAYLKWVRSRPWTKRKLSDRDLIALDEDEAWEYDLAWNAFHEDKGCRQADDGSWSHAGCHPRDRNRPEVAVRWDQLGKACVDRGCWPDGATEWDHVEGCRFWRFESPDDARRQIGGNVAHAVESNIPENALKVLRTLAATGLGSDDSHIPSIDVMASAPYLAEKTRLSEWQVRRALARLESLDYIKPVDDIEDIGLEFMRRNARRLRAEAKRPGRPANWYRILPPPAPAIRPEPNYDALDRLLAEAR